MSTESDAATELLFPNRPNMLEDNVTPSIPGLTVANSVYGLVSELSQPPNTAEDNITTSFPMADIGEGLMSEETFMSAQRTMNFVIYVLLAVGLVTNLINVVVMTRPSMRNGASRYLVAISLVQIAYLLLDAAYVIYLQFLDDIFADYTFLVFQNYGIFYVLSCLRRTQYILHCLVSTERLLAVMLPLKAKNFVIVTRPVVFVVVSSVVVFVCHFHVAVKFQVVEISQGNTTILVRRFSDFYMRHWDLMDALNVGSKVVFVYVALLYLLLANATMIVALGCHAANRRKINTNVDNEAMRRRDNQMMVTILVSTLVFVFLCLPLVTNSLVFALIPSTYGPFSKQEWLFMFVQAMGLLLVELAASTDFLAYVLLSKAYRRTLIHLFRPLLAKHGKTPGKTDVDASIATKDSDISKD